MRRLHLLVPLVAACATQPAWPTVPGPDPCAANALADAELVLRLPGADRARASLVWPGASAGPRDVVVDLHELGAEPRRQAHYSGWVPHARAVGALLVGPDGRSASWNAGAGCCGRSAAGEVDDVAFLDAVVAALAPAGCPSGRVLATGIGAGARMAHRWACESDVVDAVISVGGALQLEACSATRPIPILHVHGADDRWMPADGSRGGPPVDRALEIWRARNHATGPGRVDVRGPVRCVEWAGDAPVRACVVDGMGPTWPGARDAPPASEAADPTAAGYRWVLDAWGNE